jgi:transcriptional regulator with XRE-family HTH domain
MGIRVAAYSALGETLRAAIEKQTTSAAEVAGELGLSYESVRRYLQGTNAPPIPTLRQLANHLHLNEAELVKMRTEGRILKEFGKGGAMLNASPDAELARLWTSLNGHQRETILDLMRLWEERNRIARSQRK